MDKQTELKESYEFIVKLIDENTLFELLAKDFPEIINIDSKDYVKFTSGPGSSLDDIDEFLIAHIEQIEIKITDYLSFIDSDLHKWIAINRLQIDFELYHENFGFKDFLNRSNIITPDPYDDRKFYIETQMDFSIDHKIRELIENFYLHLIDVGISLQSNLEFELIGATPKTKPTKETKLALTQNELMYLFMKLGAKNLFTSKDKTHLARGINLLSGFSANKTREKGVDVTKTELENIKTILDDITLSLAKDIKEIKI